MSFLDWITALAGGGYRAVGDLSTATFNSIRRLWSILVTVFHLAVAAERAASHAVGVFATALRHALGDLSRILWWLVTAYVPQLVARAYTLAVTVARGVGVEAQRFASILVRTASRALTIAIGKVRSVLDAVVRWVRGEIARLWSLLNWAARLVKDLLTDARHLAVWLLPALWRYILRLLMQQAVAITRFLLPHFIGIALTSAHIIEDVIARVL